MPAAIQVETTDDVVPAPFHLSAGQVSVPIGPVSTSACRNCGCNEVKAFCPKCGQENADPIVPLGEMAREVFCEFTSTDAKLWTTLRPLLTRPGLLTAEYLKGRRASYLGPFKLYFLVSALYFLVFSTTGAERDVRQSFVFDGKLGTAAVAKETPSKPAPTPEETRKAAFKKRLLPKLVQVQNHVTDAGNWYMDHQATATIALLPVLAAGLALLYRRRRRLYAEHLVFTVHAQCFSLLAVIPCALLIMLARRSYPSLKVTDALLPLSLTITPFYEYFALQRVYGPEPKGKTALKAILWALYKLGIGALMATFAIIFIVLYLILTGK